MTHNPVPHADRDHSEQPRRCAWCGSADCDAHIERTPNTATAGSDPTHEPSSIDAAHLMRQREWSEQTFGPAHLRGPRGPLAHLRKELEEIADSPYDLEEWVDAIILALDGAWRAGHEPQQIINMVKRKQAKNEARTWPDWRGVPADQAIEHVRSDDEGEPQPGTPRSASAREVRASEAQVEAVPRCATEAEEAAAREVLGSEYTRWRNTVTGASFVDFAAQAVADAVVAAGPDADEVALAVLRWAERFIPGDRWDAEDLRDLQVALGGTVEAHPTAHWHREVTRLRAEVERLRATGLRHIDYFKAMRASRAEAEAERDALRAEVERWTEKAQEAGAAYANANSKHHAELDRANRLERLANTLAEKAVDLEDRARAAEAEVERLRRAWDTHDTDCAAVEAERDEIAGRLSALLCELTGGRLSKTTYDVRTMVTEIDSAYDDAQREERTELERLQAEVERLRDVVEQWRTTAKGARREFVDTAADLSHAVIRAEAAEAERDRLAAKMARVKSLADELASAVGSPELRAWAHWCADRLRAALSDADPAQAPQNGPEPALSREQGASGQSGEGEALRGAEKRAPSIGDTCCGKCPGGTCYVDGVTGA